VIRKFGQFWYDFIVGDDWRLAVGVVVVLLVTDVLSHAGVAMWWFIPVAICALVGVSLRHAVKDSR
jgi:hypothetical protein